MKSNHEAIYGSAEDVNLEDDDMGDITLGDRVEHHYHKEKKGMSNLAKAAAAAALVASGAGATAAIPIVLDLLSNKGGDTVVSPDSGPSIGIIELGSPDN